MATEVPDASKIDLLLFDLDGTLYENTEQYDFYVKNLASRVPVPARSGFTEDVALARQGKHAMKYGFTYVPEQRLILETEEDAPVRCWLWDGTPVHQHAILLERSTSHRLPTYVVASDPWWLPHACALHYGVSIAECEEAYHATRRYMMSREFAYRGAGGLPELMRATALRYTQVLATNSPSTEGESILSSLGISGVFDMELYRADKPASTKAIIESICVRFGTVPERVLSIGDNPYNEIYPARRIGSQTALVDPCRCYENDPRVGYRSESLSEILNLLLDREVKRAELPSERCVQEGWAGARNYIPRVAESR